MSVREGKGEEGTRGEGKGWGLVLEQFVCLHRGTTSFHKVLMPVLSGGGGGGGGLALK